MKLHSLGEQLRAARIKKELSLYDVEKFSGVEAQFLLAMEMDQLKALPEDIQQEALEKYATSVGLDGKRLFEEQRQNEQKLKKEKKPVERKEDTLAAKAPMSRFLKHKREEKRKSNYLPLLVLSAVSLLIICSVGYIIVRHLSNQPQVIKPNTISTVNHLSTASKAKSSRSISEVTVSGANVTTTTQGNQLMVDFSNVKIEPIFEEMVDFDTFSKSDFRAVKVKACEAVKKSKKLLQFTLDDGTGTNRTILSGIHAYYEPEELVGKTLIAITNLPPRAMMGIESCGMLLSAIHEEEGEEKLHLLMVDNHIPAGAKLY